MTDLWATCLGSATAGLISRIFCHPLDTIKARLQARGGESFGGGLNALRVTVAEEGVRGLYRGCGITVTRAAPGNGTPPPPAHGRVVPTNVSVPLRSSAFRVVRDGDAGTRGQTAARRGRVATRVARPTAAPANGANIG